MDLGSLLSLFLEGSIPPPALALPPLVAPLIGPNNLSYVDLIYDGCNLLDLSFNNCPFQDLLVNSNIGDDFYSSPAGHASFAYTGVVIVGTVILISLGGFLAPAVIAPQILYMKQAYVCCHAADLFFKFIYLAQQPVTTENAAESTMQWGVLCVDLFKTSIYFMQVFGFS